MSKRLIHSTLNHLWEIGKASSQPEGHLLRQARNYLGPSWLSKATLKDLNP